MLEFEDNNTAFEDEPSLMGTAGSLKLSAAEAQEAAKHGFKKASAYVREKIRNPQKFISEVKEKVNQSLPSLTHNNLIELASENAALKVRVEFLEKELAKNEGGLNGLEFIQQKMDLELKTRDLDSLKEKHDKLKKELKGKNETLEGIESRDRLWDMGEKLIDKLPASVAEKVANRLFPDDDTPQLQLGENDQAALAMGQSFLDSFTAEELQLVTPINAEMAQNKGLIAIVSEFIKKWKNKE